MPQSAFDRMFAGEPFRKVMIGLGKIKLTQIILRLGLPFYAKEAGFKLHEFSIFAVGQSHLDSAWNWRWIPDTAPYKLSHTVGYNLDRLKRYPILNLRPGYQDGYKFSFPAPAHYEYIQEHWPRSFQKVKEHVREGRWELLGGMYVEADGNCPDGESFVRQRLYGQKFYQEHFGKYAKIAWLPDTFGFAWSLPQILKKSGALGFYTTKITWNRESLPGTGYQFPFGWFLWESPDGSQVLSANISHGWRGLAKLGTLKDVARIMKPEFMQDRVYDYNTDIDKDIRRSREYIKEALWAYGEGDGGHGPMDVEIEIVDTAEKIGAMQRVKAGTVYKLIDKKYHDRLPIWKDELYLEFHRGVQTTLHRLKQQNRNAETRLQRLEKIFSFCYLLGMPFPHQLFNITWKKTLFNQFHDILPGSSIEEVYADTDTDYFDTIQPNLEKLEELPINFLKNSSNFMPSTDHMVMFYPNSAVDFNKINLEGEIIFHKSPGYIGFETISMDQLQKEQDTFRKISLIDDGDVITVQTPQLEIKFDKLSGGISTLHQKVKQPEFNYARSKGLLNKLVIFEDHPKDNDAWNIDAFYREKPCPPITIHTTAVKESDHEILIEFQFSIGQTSSGVMSYNINSTKPLIECSLEIDWQEAHRLLRVEFESDIETDSFRTGIPYGWIDRPTHPDLPLQKGRWEVPGQSFITLCDNINKRGLAVFVYDKYGFHAEDRDFGISLLRAPSYGDPDKGACAWYDPSTQSQRKQIKDLGKHSIRWSLLPFTGDFIEAEIYKKALTHSISPIIFTNTTCTDPEKLQNLLFSHKSVSLSVIKPSYSKIDDQLTAPKSLILRFHEFGGAQSECNIEWTALANAKIWEVDLLEDLINIIPDGKLQDSTFTFKMKPFEIKTFKIQIR